jgi:NADH-quinone oxidoreductase subunit E
MAVSAGKKYKRSVMQMRILVNELADIQKEYGYIPESEIIRLSEEFHMQKAQLYGVISFYSRLYTEKKGKHIIRICKSVTCGMNGSQEIRDAIIKHLHLEDSRTTEDQRFTLELVECLGLCNLSPVMTINDAVYENLTVEKALEIIDSFE